MGRLLWIAAAMLVGGCALMPGAAPDRDAASASLPEAVRVQENSEVSALLAYYQGLLDLPAEDLRREYQRTSQSFARDHSELARLRLAMLMNIPGAAWRDDAKLIGLLEGSPSRKAQPDSPRRQFVVFLLKQVAERLREQKRADELQQKLDSILAIERSLRSRQPQRK